MPAVPVEEFAPRRSGLASFGLKTKPVIDIVLDDGQQDCFVPSYTTLDKIGGVVSLTAPTNFSFDDIVITFQGSSRTYVEKMTTSAAVNGRSLAHHNFLRLVQPLDENDMPPGRIAKAGSAYRFPFTFVVPERLLPQACSHTKTSDDVHDAHLSLPPSLGDPMMAGDRKALKDDLAPAMTVISYAIRVMVTRQSPEGQGKPLVIVDKAKKLRVIPAVDEATPLKANGRSEGDYKLRQEKWIKKGVFKGKLGRVVMEASPPKSVRLPSIRAKDDHRATTKVVVDLTFHPVAEGIKPPLLQNLTNKLRITTFFASVPQRDFPREMSGTLDLHRGHYKESIRLSSHSIESVQWTPYNSVGRHDSANALSPVDSESGPITFYTAQILVPIDLPTSKTFIPTFHSCLISRTYAFDLSLSAGTSLHLTVPVQISVEPNADACPMISEAEMRAIAAREADIGLWPRSFVPPIPEYSECAEPRGSDDDIRRGLRGLVVESRSDFRAGASTSVGNDAPPGYCVYGARSTGTS